MKRESILKILNHWKDPIFLRNTFIYKLVSLFYRKNKGSYIFDESWDNLIILDACRYDIFEETYRNRSMRGTLKKKKSRGSHTISFLLENFKNGKYPEIIYITANPHVDLLLKDKFYKIISVWKEGWDNKEKTVLPKTMYEYGIDAIIKYPEKKLIFHFMQPHFPYIGYKIGGGASEMLKNTVLHNQKIKLKKVCKDGLFSLYTLDLYAVLKRKDHLNIYKDNLNLVIPFIEDLINILPGKTIVTADHGESIGEFIHPLIPIRFYGHRENVRIPVLINVPWLVIEVKEKDPKRTNYLLEREKIFDSVEKLKSFRSI
ncbi:MAG: hypothetical protein ACFFA4_07565 [Promethearchaeota archaeon]